MIDRRHGLPITRQAQLMRISRGSVYYRRKPPCDGQVQLMHSLDALHVAHPFAGSRMLKGLLQRQGALRGPQAYTDADETHVHDTAVLQAPHQCASSAAQGLSLSAAQQDGHACQSSLGHGHRKGAWRDNVFVERLWRSIKYEEVYLTCPLQPYQSVGERSRGLQVN